MSEPTGDDRAREAVETVYRSDSRRVLATLIRLACPHCGGRLRLIATLDDPAVIRKILEH